MHVHYNRTTFAIPLEDNHYYYQSFRRQLIMRFKLHQELQFIIHQKDVCDAKLDFYQKKLESSADRQSVSEPFNRLRRCRRSANEIERAYQCPYDKCSRSYGSDGSLQQHIKLKHKQQQLMAHNDKNKYSNGKMIIGKFHPKNNLYNSQVTFNQFLNNCKEMQKYSSKNHDGQKIKFHQIQSSNQIHDNVQKCQKNPNQRSIDQNQNMNAQNLSLKLTSDKKSTQTKQDIQSMASMISMISVLSQAKQNSREYKNFPKNLIIRSPSFQQQQQIEQKPEHKQQ